MDFETHRQFVEKNGSPLFVYDSLEIGSRLEILRSLQLPFGYTPRYAMKANNHPEILKIVAEAGVDFDASSSYEVVELLEMGIDGQRISLSSQQPAHNLGDLREAGVLFVATSLHQVRLAVEAGFQNIGVRINPGKGSGHNNRTTTGGQHSSFGIWHEYIDEVVELAANSDVTIDRLHIHIGSGADPNNWDEAMRISLEIAEKFPDVTSLDIGGGYKIHRYGSEHETDMTKIAEVFSTRLEEFAEKTGRKLALEIEPGTWLVAHMGTLYASVVDIVDTGSDGYNFLRLNTGMNDIIRPSMYGAQHRLEVLNDSTEQLEYVVVGHNCETGDILTPELGNPEGIAPRLLNKAEIGDVVAIYDAGAYCRTFATKGYNSFPSAAEVVV